jgi:serine/threonine-protein kinase
MSTELDRFEKIAAALTKVSSDTVMQTMSSARQKGAATVSDLKTIVEKANILDPETAARAAKWAAEPLAAPDIPDYTVFRKLGEGGMGSVFHAKNTGERSIHFGKEVALKVLNDRLNGDKNFVDRFYREARASARLDHPNVVRGFDVGEANGIHYFAMEFVDGKSLQGWLDRFEEKPLKGCPKGAIPVGDALKIILDVARALVIAEQQSMVHRDIKPDNIMLTSKGIVKLADLGLAKQTDENSSMTQTGAGFGTPYYMPLEQAVDAKHVDIRSDLYALGATLYHCITGVVPFDGETAYDVIMKKKEGKYPSPSKVLLDAGCSKLDMSVEKLVDWMMQKTPDDRLPFERRKDGKDLLADKGWITVLVETIEGMSGVRDTLSFISGAVASPTGAASRAPTVMMSGGGGKSALAKTEALDAGSTAAEEGKKRKPAQDPDLWFLRYKDATGKQIKTKASTNHVRKLIQEGTLDESVEAAKSPEGPFRRLQAWGEFESLVRARMQQKKVDVKAKGTGQSMSNLIDNFDREQSWHKTKRKAGDAVNWIIGLVITVTILGGGGWAVWNFILKDQFAKNQASGAALEKTIQDNKAAGGR